MKIKPNLADLTQNTNDKILIEDSDTIMNLIPNEDEFWKGIGGTFDNFTDVIAELIDNALANMRANKVISSTIVITINQDVYGNIVVQIEDSGTGIKKPENAFKVGDKCGQEDTLNEHGFGMKHGLASANPENNAWSVYTRTEEDLKNGVYKAIRAPYRFEMYEEIINASKQEWPGQLNTTGTIIRFNCSKSFFETLQQGIPGKAGIIRCLKYLNEDIGFLYSNAIQKGEVNIIVTSDTEKYYERVEAVCPIWAGFYNPDNGKEKVDLGGGMVEIEYAFGEMKESEYSKYYKRNQSTSGCEIRINGRLILKNELKGIWKIENHPHYNHFLAKINIISDDPNRLPKTKTNKSGIRIGDEKFDKLYKWIRNIFPTPPRSLSGAINEKELVARLSTLKETHNTGILTRVEREFVVYRNIGCPVKVDLYVSDGYNVYLYEAKRGVAEAQNVYQLLMYWDGAVNDGIIPTNGVLIATSFPDGIRYLVNKINNTVDEHGNYYNFILKTWKDELVDYPE